MTLCSLELLCIKISHFACIRTHNDRHNVLHNCISGWCIWSYFWLVHMVLFLAGAYGLISGWCIWSCNKILMYEISFHLSIVINNFFTRRNLKSVLESIFLNRIQDNIKRHSHVLGPNLKPCSRKHMILLYLIKIIRSHLQSI